MKVVNCCHCGTPNVINEHGHPRARCIKCGNYVELSTSLFSLLPGWALALFCIIGFLLLVSILPIMYFIYN